MTRSNPLTRSNPMKPMLAVSFFLLALAFSVEAFGQSIVDNIPAAESQKVSIISSSLKAARSTESMSPKQELMLRKSAELAKIVDQVNAIPTGSLRTVLNDVARDANSLSVGESRKYTVKTAAPLSKNAIEGTSFNVRVSYEARPVGGILQVSVELVKGFSGIGMSSRPIARESFTQAIDEFSQELTDKVVGDLKASLTAKFEALAAAK